MTPNVPADLTGVSDEELAGLDESVREAAEAIGDTAATDDQSLKALESLVGDHQRIQDEIGSRKDAETARAERVAAALERIGGDPHVPDAPDGPDPDEPDLPDPAAELPIAATTEQHNTMEDPAVTNPPATANTVAALTSARPAHTAPVDALDVVEGRPVSKFFNTGAVFENQRGEPLDRRALALMVAEQARRFARSSGTTGPVILAHAETQWGADEQLSAGDHERNFTIMEQAGKKAEALVASGANCALLTPNYDIPTWAQVMSPVEDALPTVGAPRGGIRYVTPPSWPQAQDGVRVTTGAQDAAGYTTNSPAGPTAVKPCVRLECPPPLECTVDAVSACVELGNLQSMTFPELIQVFMDHLAVAQAQTKEIYYLDGIDAGSTEVNYTGTYGATRSLVHALALAAHGMRKRLHMPLDAPLDILAADTLVPLIRTDMVNDLNLGLGFLNADPLQVARELFTALRINPTWYYDYSADVGVDGAMQTAQTAGTINPFPVTYRSWMFPPGTWVRLDGGTLDVGMIRDSSLVETNDYRIFSEEWVQVCKRGAESIALDIAVCANGSAPAAVTPFTCSS